MATQAPRLRVTNNAGNTIRINNDWDIVFQTQLQNNIPNGVVGTFVVGTTQGLTTSIGSGNVNDVQWYVGNLGTPSCELITTVGTVSILNSTVTVTSPSTLQYNHTKGEDVTLVAFNAVDLFKNGTLLATIFLQPNQPYTTYKDVTGVITDSYSARYRNSKPATPVLGTMSGSTSPTTYGTTAGYVIDAARSAVGNVSLTDDFFISALNDARNIIDTDYSYGYLWDWRQKFNQPIRMVSGKNYIPLPSDIDFNTTNRSILTVRYTLNMLSGAVPLQYIDKENWNNGTWRSNGLDVVSYDGTNLVLNNTADLPTQGSLICSAIDSTGTMTISYTSNNINTNTISGITGNTRTINPGDQIWAAGANLAYPTGYTIFGNRLYFNTVIPNVLNNKSVYIDYYIAMTPIVDITDVVPEHYRNAYKHYLKFAAKRRRNDSIGTDDPDYKQFLNAIATVINNQSLNKDVTITNG